MICGVVYQLSGKAALDWNKIAPALCAASDALAAAGNFDDSFARMYALSGSRGVVR